MTNEIPQPLPPLTDAERIVVARLSEAQRLAIDAALLEQVLPRWRKVAMVVFRAMEQPSHVVGVPDTYYGQRICEFVDEGRIEAQGNVQYMRFSEVRLWSADNEASREA